MDLSVLIPTLNRPDHLARCLCCLREQTEGSGRFEVVVILDGPDPASDALVRAFDPGGRFDLRLIRAERRGIAHAKNLGLEAARGELLVLLNDDVRPAPDFLSRHRAAHAEAPAAGEAARMVLGASPWVVHQPDTLFARLLRGSSMIFFYDRMIGPDGAPTRPHHHDWGWRHAWNLNLSLRADLARAVGGFDAAIANCCYEDVEFAWRFTRRFAAPVLFRPDAVAEHDHPYTPADYLRREFRLGYSAWGFAHANPACAAEVFRRDMTSSDAVAEARAALEADEPRARSWRAWFESLHEQPALPGVDLSDLYREHLPLKRFEFRRGLLAAAEGEVIEGLFPATARPAAATIPSDAHFSGTAAAVRVAGPRDERRA